MSDELDKTKYFLRRKLKEDSMDKEDLKMIKEFFTTDEIIEMMLGINRNHITLVKWLYDLYPEILREYEKKSGIMVHFAGRD